MKLLIILLSTFISFAPSCTQAISKKEKITLKLLNSFSDQQKAANNLRMIGVGGAMPQEVQEVSLHFITHKQLTLEQARRLYISVVQDLLARVNSNSEIRPFLKDYPFTCHNVDLLISFKTPEGQRIQAPFIALVGLANGRIFFSINDRERDLLKTIHREPYEEALKIVKEKSGTSLELKDKMKIP